MPPADGEGSVDGGAMATRAHGTAHTAYPTLHVARAFLPPLPQISALADAVGRGHVTPTPTPDPDPCELASRQACALRLSELAPQATSPRTGSAGGATPPGRALGLQDSSPDPR
jgi:hypothetical protein